MGDDWARERRNGLYIVKVESLLSEGAQDALLRAAAAAGETGKDNGCDGPPAFGWALGR
jgi:hypothetical protein